MLPKEFIQQVLVEEVKDVIDSRHPLLGFVLIGTGIEYLGRCLDTAREWDADYKGVKLKPFDRAITELFPQPYHDKEVRKRLLHFYSPTKGLLLSQAANVNGVIDRSNHPYRAESGDVTLVVEYLYDDFVDACHEVIRRSFPVSDKMSKLFIDTSMAVSR